MRCLANHNPNICQRRRIPVRPVLHHDQFQWVSAGNIRRLPPNSAVRCPTRNPGSLVLITIRSVFYMDTGIDTGDVIAQRKFSIGQEDTVNDLLEKITRIAPRLVLKYFDMIVEGRAPRVRQNNLKSSHTPRRRPKDSEINWLWDVKKIHRFIRALTYPYPSAFFQIRNKKITLISGKLMKNKKIMIEGYIEENGKRKE